MDRRSLVEAEADQRSITLKEWQIEEISALRIKKLHLKTNRHWAFFNSRGLYG